MRSLTESEGAEGGGGGHEGTTPHTHLRLAARLSASVTHPLVVVVHWLRLKGDWEENRQLCLGRNGSLCSVNTIMTQDQLK